MRCDLDKVPSVGLFGWWFIRGGLRAQKMFDKYGLNKSQAGILFMLHHEEAVSQKPLSQKELAKKLNVTRRLLHLRFRRWRRLDLSNDSRTKRIKGSCVCIWMKRERLALNM